MESYTCCKYGLVSGGVCILFILLGYAYLFCISISSPSLGGSFIILGIFVCLMEVFVLLNENFYCGNILWISFVNQTKPAIFTIEETKLIAKKIP